MSAKKNDSVAVAERSGSGGGLGRSLRGNLRWMSIVAVVVIGSAVAWKVLWEQVRERVVGSAEYRLDPAAIEINKPPEYIHANVKAEVIRDASLDGALSILDPDLTVSIASAFRLHPWVARVERVSKRFPAGVQVELVYRRPIAMVEVPGPALLPVDVEGVLLPTEDFSPVDAKHYPRIGEIKTSPIGPVGTRWGDTRVAGAAAVAATLLPAWEELKLYQIVPAGQLATLASGVETDAYEIFTKAGTRIDWGRPPGAEASSEPKAATKLVWLCDYAAKHNASLDDPDSPVRFDVRRASGLAVSARPPVKPLVQPSGQ